MRWCAISSATIRARRMTHHRGAFPALATAAGLALGAWLGRLVALSIRSDNGPLFALLGALVGMAAGLLVGYVLKRRRAGRS